MSGTPETPEIDPSPPSGMLEEPTLSRQWVARRLQRALSMERWLGPARIGLGRVGGPLGSLLRAHGESSALRRRLLEELLGEIGVAPYADRGIGARCARAAATVPALLSRTLAVRIARQIAAQTMAEYRALEGFVRDAPGVPPHLADELAPWRQTTADEHEMLAGLQRANR